MSLSLPLSFCLSLWKARTLRKLLHSHRCITVICEDRQQLNIQLLHPFGTKCFLSENEGREGEIHTILFIIVLFTGPSAGSSAGPAAFLRLFLNSKQGVHGATLGKGFTVVFLQPPGPGFYLVWGHVLVGTRTEQNINSYFSSYSFPGELEPMGAGLHPGKENCREIVQMHNPVKVRIYFVFLTKDPWKPKVKPL